MVICVSMKIRMNTRTAGSRLATIIHTGKGLFSPRGLMTQPRLSGAVTENPLGTLSFCKAEGVCCYTEGTQWNIRTQGGGNSPVAPFCYLCNAVPGYRCPQYCNPQAP